MAVPARPSTSPGVAAPQSAVTDLSPDSGAIRAEPNDPFWLVVYPNSPTGWNVETRGVEEPTYLPCLNPMPLVEGANGIRSTGKGEDPARGRDGAKLKLANDGAIIIDPSKYLLKTPCSGGGAYYHTPWQVLRQPLAGQRMIPKIDHAVYAAFRLSLVEDGIVPPPSDQIIAYLEQQAEERLSSVRVAVANETAEIRELRMAKASKRVDSISKARKPWEAAVVEAAPKAKRAPKPEPAAEVSGE